MPEVRTDRVNIIVNVNGDPAQNQLNNLRKRAVDLKAEMKQLTKGTAEYAAKAKELSAVNTQMDELKKTIGLTALSQKELMSELRKLNAMKGSVVPFSQEFKDLQTRIDAVQRRLYDVQNGVQGLASVFSRVKDEVKQFGMLMAGYLGFQFITAQFKNIISSAGKLSDSFADIQRVTGMTAVQVDELNKSLGRMDTRTSTSGLREIAIIAGKLGVANEDIRGFTEAVDKLVVSLGDELGDADQVTTQLGKILNVFDGKIDGDNITKLGNAFVALANSGAATGGFIADFDQRLAGIAKSSNISLGALSGLGAGLEELGARVESSATAVQKLIIGINSDLPKAAKIAGKSVEEFKELMQVDPTEGLLQYSEGLMKDKKSFDEVVASMTEAGESGTRVIETLSKLGGNADDLRKRIELGKEAIQETGEIMDAFALKNETLGAELDKLGKIFFQGILESGIIDFFKNLVTSVIDLIKWLKDLPSFIERNRITLGLLTTAIIAMNRELIILTLQWLRERAAIILTTVAQTAASVATLAYRAVLLSFATVQALVTGNITRATAAWKLLNLAFKSSPIGAVITLVAGLGVALDSLFSKITAMQKAQQDLAKRSIDNYGDQVNKIENLKRALESENVSYETKKAVMKELIALNPSFADTLRMDADGHLQGAQAIDEYVASLKRKGKAEAAQELSNVQYKRILALQQERMEWEKTAKFSDQAREKMIANIDRQIAEIQKVKDFYDSVVQSNTTASIGIVRMPDTLLPGSRTEDTTVAARRKSLEGEIEKLKAAYETLNKTDDAGQRRNLALRKKYQDELDKLDHRQSASPRQADNDRKRDMQEVERFMKDIERLKAQALIASKTTDEQELLNLQSKYAEMHNRAMDFFKRSITDRKTFNEQEKAIIEAFQLELDNLNKKQFGQLSEEEYKRALQDTEDFFDEQRNLAGQNYANGITDKQQYDREIGILNNLERDQRVTVAKDYVNTVKSAEADLRKFQKDASKTNVDNEIKDSERRIEIARREAMAKAQLAVIAAPEGSRARMEAQKALAEEQFRQDVEGLDKSSELYKLHVAQLEEARQKIEEDFRTARIHAFADFADQLQSIAGNLMGALNNLNDRDLEKDRLANEEKKKLYQNQLDHKLISKRAYDKKVEEADKEFEKKQKETELKAFKRQQALAITAALINGALAVTATLAARPGLADIFTLGAARAIQIGLVVAATAAQVTEIASRKPPSAGRGKLLTHGPYHRDPERGLHVVDPRTGNVELLLEKDEMVLMGAATRDKKRYTVSGTPSQIGSALNSMHGGVSWAHGATVSPMPRWNIPTVSSRMPRIMEQGGIIRPMAPSSASIDIDSLTAEQRRTNELIETQIDSQQELIRVTKEKNERLHAVVSLRELNRQQAALNAVQRNSSIN